MIMLYIVPSMLFVACVRVTAWHEFGACSHCCSGHLYTPAAPCPQLAEIAEGRAPRGISPAGDDAFGSLQTRLQQQADDCLQYAKASACKAGDYSYLFVSDGLHVVFGIN